MVKLILLALPGIIATCLIAKVSTEQCTITSSSGKTALRIDHDKNRPQIKIYLQNKRNRAKQEVLILSHSLNSPAIYVGKGETNFTDYRGNFNITDYTAEKIPLPYFEGSQRSNLNRPGLLRATSCNFFTFKNTDGNTGKGQIQMTITFSPSEVANEDTMTINIGGLKDGYDRLWIRFASSADERFYGAGEQFTHFNLKGKSFPIWTREQGVGRDKSSYITFLSDTQDGGAGGDYHTTYWPQPLFYSDQLYSVSMTSSRYSVFDFEHEDFTEIQVLDNNTFHFDFNIGANWMDITTITTDYLLGGKSRPWVPEWTYKGGSILGLQGGTDIVLKYYDKAVQNGVKVSGIWIQDWVGRIETSFGKRLFWDWQLNETQYPRIREVIKEKEKEGVYFIAYINPYLNQEGEMFKQAKCLGYLVKDKHGNTHVSDFGEFYCGTVDLTNEHAFNWYKRRIQQNMIDIGFKGWMADFGEYLPVDEMAFAGSSGAELHNLWPSLWARVNREAIEERGMMGEIFVWMRAGHTESPKYAISAWAGDQNVDWSLGDGLASVMPAALSLGMSGVGISHFDIGGFTSLFGVVRTEELLLRSAELAVFTPAMRTHEGNRPDQNWQVYSTDRTLKRFGRLSRLHVMLGNYTATFIKIYNDTGIPIQRPMFFEFPKDEGCYDDLVSKYQYMYGSELLVAPIYTEGQVSREVYFPIGETWISIWDSLNNITSTIEESTYDMPSPMGETPVFYKEGSEWEEFFKRFKNERATPYNSSGVILTPFLTLIFAILTATFIWC